MITITRENYPLELGHQLGIMSQEQWFDRFMCGIDELNKLGGLYAGINVVAARPGVGAHSFVASIAANFVSAQRNVIVLSTLYHLEKWKRFIASNIVAISQGKANNIFSGKTKEELDKVMRQNCNVSIIVCRNYEELEGELFAAASPGLVIIDSLPEIHFNNASLNYENFQLESDRIMEKLAVLSKNMQIPFIVLSPLNRNPEYRCGIEGKLPQIKDLQIRNLEQYTQMLIFLYRPSYYHVTMDEKEGHDLTHKIQIIVEKNFDYPTGDFWLDFDYKHHRIGGLPDIYKNMESRFPF